MIPTFGPRVVLGLLLFLAPLVWAQCASPFGQRARLAPDETGVLRAELPDSDAGTGELLATRTPTPGPIEVQLRSAQSAAVPGGSLTLVLQLLPEAGYHTYWRFPGVVGLATSLTLDVPKSFAVGPLQWPVPERSDMAGHGVWAYRGPVELRVDVAVPRELECGSVVTVRARASWMACSRTCHPGNKDFELRIPVAAHCRTLLGSSATRPTWDARWRFEAKRVPNGYVLIGRHRDGQRVAAGAYFFNSNAQVDSHRDQRMERTPDGFRLHLPRWEYAEPADRLSGLLVCRSGLWPGGPVAIYVEAPITP